MLFKAIAFHVDLFTFIQLYISSLPNPYFLFPAGWNADGMARASAAIVSHVRMAEWQDRDFWPLKAVEPLHQP